MECLFDAGKPHFATWLWIYNEDGGDSMSTTCPENPKAAPLYYAARLGFCDLAEHLIASNPEHVNARARGDQELAPMHVAAQFRHDDILSLLLENGADPEGEDAYIMTPLHRASWRGTLEAVLCLLDHGANIKARDRDGWTPLHCAVQEKNRIQVVRLLLERGADVNACDNRGRTPSQHAVERKQAEQEVVELLSKYGTKSVE
jgi:ankyrin repeat protein